MVMQMSTSMSNFKVYFVTFECHILHGQLKLLQEMSQTIYPHDNAYVLSPKSLSSIKFVCPDFH